MAESVAFPDIEAALVSYLNAEYTARSDSATASTRVPAEVGRFVKVTRVGGPRRNLVTDAPMVTFECWDPNGVAASELAALTRALVGALDGSEAAGIWVRKVSEIGGPQNYPDPRTTSPRYQFTVQMHTRGEAI